MVQKYRPWKLVLSVRKSNFLYFCLIGEIVMQGILRFIMKVLSWILLVPVYFYKYALSPLIPASCRHVPTCSQYAIEAIKIHGPFKGLWLAIRRISRCHPWGTHGYDPVPPKGKIVVKQLQLKKSHHLLKQRNDGGVK